MRNARAQAPVASNCRPATGEGVAGAQPRKTGKHASRSSEGNGNRGVAWVYSPWRAEPVSVPLGMVADASRPRSCRESSIRSVRQNLPPNTPALRHQVSSHRGVLERAERQNRSLKLVPHAMTDSGHHRPHQTPALASAKRFKSAGSPVAGQQVSTRAHLAIARAPYVPERERRVKRGEGEPVAACVAVDALPSSIGAIGGSQATRPRWLRWMMVELHRRLRLSRGAQET